MPLNVNGNIGFGHTAEVAGLCLSGGLECSETVPLLIPDSAVQQSPHLVPMGKAELERVAGSAWWRTLRWRLAVLFWLGWLAMLCAAIAIIAQSPRPVAPPLRWWQKALFYRLQPALLLDSESTGVGDITVTEYYERLACLSAGVRDRLPYLKSLGVGALILEGLFPQGLPLSDPERLNYSLGTLPQFQELLVEGHKSGLRILLDLCGLDLSDSGPVNSGNQTEMLIDAPGSIQHALQLWLEQGVAGFCICDTDVAYSEQILKEWRVLVQKFSKEGSERIVVVRLVGNSGHQPYVSDPMVNSSLVELVTRSLLPPSLRPLSLDEVAVSMEKNLLTAQGAWPSWALGGVVTQKLQRILMVLMMTLPGTPVIKYGEEIGQLQNVSVTWDNEPGEKEIEKGVLLTASPLFHSLSQSRSQEEALLFGSFTLLPFNASVLATSNTSSSPVLAFLRSWGCVHFLVLLNMGPDVWILDQAWAPGLPAGGVFVASTGLDRLGSLKLKELRLRPQEAVVIKLFEPGNFS